MLRDIPAGPESASRAFTFEAVMPKRIQRKRRKGWKMPANSVYVGRPTKWGNPFVVGKDWRQSYFTCMDAALRGKNLACWCPLDQPCHADVLLEIANK